jgi:hypothetical protein
MEWETEQTLTPIEPIEYALKPYIDAPKQYIF